MGGLVYSVNSVSGREYSAPRLPRDKGSAGGRYETVKPRRGDIYRGKSGTSACVLYINSRAAARPARQRRGPRDSGAGRGASRSSALTTGGPNPQQEFYKRSCLPIQTCLPKVQPFCIA